MILGRCRAILDPAFMVAIAVTLADCSYGSLRDERINAFPDNYKADLLAAMRTYVADPINIRDAYLSDPALRPIGGQNRYTVCVRFNAKNSDGRYVGSRDAMAIFVSGRFDQFVDQAPQTAQPSSAALQAKEACAQADYRRFGELEALTR